MIFHFLSLCVFISIQNIGRSILLKGVGCVEGVLKLEEVYTVVTTYSILKMLITWSNFFESVYMIILSA